MSELFQPITAEQLFAWLFSELDARDSAFGIPRQHFFCPREDDRFRTSAFGHVRLLSPSILGEETGNRNRNVMMGDLLKIFWKLLR